MPDCRAKSTRQTLVGDRYMNSQSQIDKLIQTIITFRDDRDWEQFHNLKDLSIGLSIESAELMELFLWKDIHEVEEYIKDNDNLERVKEELADIIIFCLLIVNKLHLNLEDIVLRKIEKNNLKYPVEQFKGNAKKYNR